MPTRIRIFVLFASVVAAGCGGSNLGREREIQMDERGRPVIGDLVVTTESESRGRAELLPTKPSEDARHVLGTIELPEAPRPDAIHDYLPEPAVNWVVDVQLDGDPPLDPRSVAETFDKAWRESFGGFMGYGRDADTGRWAFLVSADGPKRVDRLKFDFDYIDVSNEDAPTSTERDYSQRLEQLAERMKRFGKPTVTAKVPPAQAAERSRLLRDIRDSLDMNAVLILKAPRGKQFDGKIVWDVMLCLGLEWGDMDCFHWRNFSGVGDDSFFSVETTTAPGYFLPEQVAAGRVHVDDLVFVYSVPRCAKPLEVFDAMTRAVEFCKSRLGGTIVDAEGNPVDAAALRRRIVEVADGLRSAGFEPGRDATLQLF